MATTETTTTCPRHPKVETNLRCASCGTLICPKCLVQTPVGMKCRACGTQKGKVFTLSPLNVFCGSAAGLVLGIVAGLGVDFLGWFTIFVAVAYGSFAGEMIIRAAGRKRGSRMEVLAGVALAVGAIGGRLLVTLLFAREVGHSPHILGLFAQVARLCIPSPIAIVSLAIAIGSAIGRIRYI